MKHQPFLLLLLLLYGQTAFAATHYSKVASPNLSSFSMSEWDTAACGTTAAGNITSYGTNDTFTLCGSTANGRVAANITALSGQAEGGYNIAIESGASVTLSGDTVFGKTMFGTLITSSIINSGGSFQLNAHSLTARNIAVSAGTFDATNATLVIYGNLTQTGGTFTTTGSTVKLTDGNHTLDGVALNNLQWDSALTAARTITINGAITYTGTFDLSGSSSANTVTFTGTGSVSPAVTLTNCTSTVTGINCPGAGGGGGAGGQNNQTTTTTSTPGLPPLPPTMNLNVDTSSTGLQFIEIYSGKNYPGTDSKLSTCKAGDTCSFTLETASWVLLKPFAMSGYQFDNQWSGSQYCNNGNPFMISNMTCKPYFKVLSPELPTGLSANAVSTSQIDLTWRDNSSRETGYLVERSSDQTIWTTLARTVANTTTYADLGLTCDTTYYYRVTAYNSSGQSAPSNIVSAITLACPIPPPVTPPPVVDPVPLPVVPPTPPVTDPTPPTPPATDPTPPVTEPTPPVETPVTQPTEKPTTPEEKPVEVTPPVETTPPVENTPTEPTPEPLPTETAETPTNLQLAEKPPVAEGPCPTDRHYNVHLDEACNAEGKIIEKDLRIVLGGHLANAIFKSNITCDEGWVGSNITVAETARVESCVVTGNITNHGLMQDIECRGQSITGGTLAGIIIIGSQVKTQICDVILAAGTAIQGKVGNEFAVAKLCGKITGDPMNPAKLENVTITAGTQLDNVILGKDVILEDGVILGENVTFADGSQKPEEPTVCEPNALGLDKNGKEINGLKACFTVKPGQQSVEISVQIDSAHVGQKADLLLVIKASPTEWYSLDQNKWKSWNGNLDSLKAKETFKALPETIVLDLANTELSALGNQLTLFVGYQLQDGMIVYNPGESL